MTYSYRRNVTGLRISDFLEKAKNWSAVAEKEGGRQTKLKLSEPKYSKGERKKEKANV